MSACFYPHPAFHCGACGRHIGLRAIHLVLLEGDGHVLCTGCSGLPLHDQFYPDCVDTWHDVYDHPVCTAVGRVSAAFALWERA